MTQKFTLDWRSKGTLLAPVWICNTFFVFQVIATGTNSTDGVYFVNDFNSLDAIAALSAEEILSVVVQG